MTEEEFELEKIFSKHLDSNSITKPVVHFNEADVKNNKKEIQKFQQENLIRMNKHFCLADEEFDNENEKKEFEFENKNKKKENYFKSLVDETMKNDSLYCSYLDYFDKIWAKNNIGIILILY
jgi:hypothetical protein